MTTAERYSYIEGFVPRERDVDRLAALYGHLSQSEVVFSQLQRATTAPTSTLVVVEDTSRMCLVGMGLISIVDLMAKRIAIINDLVVHPEHQSKGIGGRIIDTLIRIATDKSCTHIDLTSSPHRLVAHALYENRGFRRRTTSALRLKLDPIEVVGREASARTRSRH